MVTRRSGIFLILLSAVCWSLGGLLIKLVPWHPMAIVCVRGFIAAGVMILYSHSWRLSLNRYTILGGCALFLTSVLFIVANKMTTAANAIVLQYTSPAFIILINGIIFKVRPLKIDLLAVGATLIGIVFFFLDDLSMGQMLGNILAVGSGVTFSVMMVVSNRAPSPIQGSLLGQLTCGVVGLPFFIMQMGNVSPGITQWVAIAILGTVQLGLGYVLFSKGIKSTPPLLASLISCAEPILNPIWVLIAMGERPGKWAVIGFAIVLLSVAVYCLYAMRTYRDQDTTANADGAGS